MTTKKSAKEAMKVNAKKTTKAKKPQYVLDLEAAYGGPNQEGFGSAVFFVKLVEDGELEKVGQEKYQYFVGDLWERWGEDTWMGPWNEVYARGEDTDHDIVAELKGIEDDMANMSVDTFLENNDVENAQDALSAAYDPDEVEKLSAYNIGDGDAMSGILIAGRRSNGEATILAFLLD